MASAPTTINVLHVDDEPGFVEMAAEFLCREDDRFEVTTATSGDEALEQLNSGGFDAIVSDYDMPRKNGLEVLRSVRENNPDLPFVLFTGKGSEEIAADAISAGVSDYIQKQSGVDQYVILANRLVNLVERCHAVRQKSLGQRAMETVNEGLSLVDPDGTFSYVNPAFAALFGYEPPELIGEHWKVLYHNEEAERLENDILPAVPETGYWSGETVRLTKSGERLVTDHRLAHTDEGVIVCTAQDVTKERVTSESQANGFGLLVDAMEEYAFYTLDHEGYVTRWNKGATRLKGYQAAEILGRHLATFFTEEDRENQLPEQLIERAKTDGSTTDEGWRVRKNGSRFWADVRLSASYDDSGTLRGFGQMIREFPQRSVALSNQ